MTKTEIIRKIKAKMEEITPFDDGLMVLDPGVKPIESYIDEMLQPALDRLLMICPLHLTKETALPYTGLTTRTDNNKLIGLLPIPDDFIRIHTFKMNTWERPVHRTTSTENPEYILQLNPYTRGGNSKPVIVKKEKLEIYTYSTGATVEISLYVKKVDVNDTQIDIKDKLINPLIALTASMVYAIFGSKQSEIMLQEVDNLLKAEL